MFDLLFYKGNQHHTYNIKLNVGFIAGDSQQNTSQSPDSCGVLLKALILFATPRNTVHSSIQSQASKIHFWFRTRLCFATKKFHRPQAAHMVRA